MYDAAYDARYSVLFIGHVPDEDRIRGLLERGIKVILLCDTYHSDPFKSFKDAGLFSSYIYSGNEVLCVVDGDLFDCRERFERAASTCPSFNREQYLIEHAPIGQHVFVMAGAGTGKTHVMIDRMMFLFHMDPEMNFSEVCFVTFTNKAAGHIEEELIKAFNNRFNVIRDNGVRGRYLSAIEDMAQMNISTIHSFFRSMLKQMGTLLGYGRGFSLRSFKEEKKNIIRDIIDECYKQKGGRVQDQMVLTVYEMQELAMEFWEAFDNNGLTEGDIKELDWGAAEGDKNRKIQDVLIRIFRESGGRYQEEKRKYDAISMGDIIHELGNTVRMESAGDYISQRFRYMFCDEFQDSDDVQIQCMAIMSKMFRSAMFVVGDLKQSIYRFRGATDSAFKKLKEALEDNSGNEIPYYTLEKNYRTSPDIIDKIQPIFNGWGDLLPDHIQIRTAKDFPGEFIVEKVTGRNRRARNTVRKELFIQRVGALKDKGEIEILVRYNAQLDDVRKWCKEAHQACYIHERGTFYRSNAVLDLRRVLGSFLYPDEPMYQYEFMRSSYSESAIDAGALIRAEGDRERLMYFFDEKRPDWWYLSKERFIKEPAFTVLKDIVSVNSPAVRYGRMKKAEYLKDRYKEKDADNQAYVDMSQYDADLEKIMLILFQRFGRDRASLLDMYSFLEIMINTDKSEDRPLLSAELGKGVVRGMTVHSAKGLQFDNVILPFMNSDFFNEKFDHILFDEDKKRIGWCYHGNKDEIFSNRYYKDSVDDEKKSVSMDEARLLYVAMTRAVRGLYCFIEPGEGKDNWASLLERGDLTDVTCL